ncbi:MAG: GDYXXLXY domain-containing protein [Caulobacter sp.]|nr:GDYXXLXY domain-containing protein [Caulobacter sp.]
MTRFRPWLTILAALLLVAALVLMVLREYQARQAGAEVALRVQQVDPRSLLSGHYVQLDFLDAAPPGFDCNRMGLKPGEPDGWIALRPIGDHHGLSGVAKTSAAAARLGGPVLRGEVLCLGPPEARQVALKIGIDRFHAAQKEAEALEALMRTPGDHAVFALVSVGEDGRARLAGMRVDGRETRLDWFGG